MKISTLSVVFLLALLTQPVFAQYGYHNALVPASFSSVTTNCGTQFNRFPNAGHFMGNIPGAHIVEVGQLYQLSTYWYAPIPQDSNPTIDTVGIIVKQAGSSVNGLLRANIYAADSTGSATLLATSADVNTNGLLDSLSAIFFPFPTPVHVPDWIIISVELVQPADTINLLTTVPGCVAHKANSFVRLSDSTLYAGFLPFQNVYSVLNDSNQVVPAQLDFAVLALMGNRVAPPPTAACSDFFLLYADSSVSHLWHIYNVTNGQAPVTVTVSWGDGSSSSTLDTVSHTYAAPGYYNICITMVDDSGCTSTDCDSSFYINRLDGSNQMITVTLSTTNSGSTATGVKPVTLNSNQLTVSPNPCSTCNVKGVDNEKDLLVTDLLGRKVNVLLTKTSSGLTLSLLDNHTGIYLLKNIKTGEVVKVVGN